MAKAEQAAKREHNLGLCYGYLINTITQLGCTIFPLGCEDISHLSRQPCYGREQPGSAVKQLIVPVEVCGGDEL
jgi:hypothetical protein